jgi:hypothetical protein
VLDVELFSARSDVARSQRLVALAADEVEPCKVIALAKRVLSIGVLNGEELLRNNLVAVLAPEAVEVVHLVQGTDKLATHGEATLGAVCHARALGRRRLLLMLMLLQGLVVVRV